MSIVQKKTETGQIVYTYRQPDWEILYDRLEEVLSSLKIYVDLQQDLALDDIGFDMTLLAEALIRVDKRRDYFLIYHDETTMNELKEAALLAYWVLKFKPFYIKSRDEALCNKYRRINEAFAVFIIYSIIKKDAEKTPNMTFRISKSYNKKIMYGFMFWDLSKESIMLISESLCEAMRFKKGK